MEIVKELVTNRMLLAAVLAWAVAQGSKVLFEALTGRFTAARMAGGGGMPSAHSATVTALALSAGLTHGFGGAAFALALFLAIFVIYDSRGVRYETGREAKALNRLRERELAEGRAPSAEKPLEEHMGHTIPEILVGMGIGIAAAAAIALIFR